MMMRRKMEFDGKGFDALFFAYADLLRNSILFFIVGEQNLSP